VQQVALRPVPVVLDLDLPLVPVGMVLASFGLAGGMNETAKSSAWRGSPGFGTTTRLMLGPSPSDDLGTLRGRLDIPPKMAHRR
jgi:hypothetical protein